MNLDFLNHSVFPVITSILNLPVFPNGKHHITLWMIIYLIILLFVLFTVTNFTKKWLIESLLAKTNLDRGVRYALGAIFSYALMTVGLLIILDTAGIDVTIVTVIFGALGIGISLSLQNIISNLFAGIIILIERPIKVGDLIQIDNTTGEVVDISLRATSIITNRNAAVIVPNSSFITSQVVNLSYRDKLLRISIPVSIDTDQDPEHLLDLLKTVVSSHKGVITERPVEILLNSFGKDNSKYTILLWTQTYAQQPDLLQSDINRAISKELRKESIKATVESAQVEETVYEPRQASNAQPPDEKAQKAAPVDSNKAQGAEAAKTSA
jgi:small-conductance mechanosensitive channel